DARFSPCHFILMPCLINGGGVLPGQLDCLSGKHADSLARIAVQQGISFVCVLGRSAEGDHAAVLVVDPGSTGGAPSLRKGRRCTQHGQGVQDQGIAFHGDRLCLGLMFRSDNGGMLELLSPFHCFIHFAAACLPSEAVSSTWYKPEGRAARSRVNGAWSSVEPRAVPPIHPRTYARAGAGPSHCGCTGPLPGLAHTSMASTRR